MIAVVIIPATFFIFANAIAVMIISSTYTIANQAVNPIYISFINPDLCACSVASIAQIEALRKTLPVIDSAS